MAALMDITAPTIGFNFYDYLFIRRINSALNNCGDNGIIQPVKIHFYNNNKVKNILFIVNYFPKNQTSLYS